MIAYIISIIVGLATPVQMGVNARLRQRIGSQLVTSLISFGGAVLALVLIVFAMNGNLNIPLVRVAEEPWWIWLGGPFGVVIVITSILAMPRLGGGITMMLISFGQIFTNLITDQWGVFNTEVIPMDIWRLTGSVIVIAGVAAMSIESDSGKALSMKEIPYILAGLACGSACGLQIAVNGTLRTVVGDPFKTTLISMTAAVLTILLFVAVVAVTKGSAGIFNEEKGDFRLRAWMLTGGLFAVVIVGGNAVSAPIIGAGLVTVMNLSGQMGMGLIMDAVGFPGMEKKAVTGRKLLGMAAMVAGTAIISLL